MDQPWEVSELVEHVRDVLEDGVGTVDVLGEISNFRRQTSGHLYFTLKDDRSQIKAVMFQGNARRLAFRPEDGIRVKATGLLTVYTPRGDMQIKLESMQPDGKGSLQEQYEALKRKLAEEGLFDPARKKPLPAFPRHIGIVTSPTGAALQDFLNIIRRRCPRLALSIYGARVQGDGAAAEVRDGLAYFNTRDDIDVIILTRGGGSLEDLWAFNDEPLARAVAASRIPVISAVGHEIDFALTDFTADLRAPTPSTAAELVCTADSEWAARLTDLQSAMTKSLRQSWQDASYQLAAFRDHYVFREPVRIVETYQQKLDDLASSLTRGLDRARRGATDRLDRAARAWARTDPRRLLEHKDRQRAALARQLALLSPQAVLERGYTMVLDPSSGKLIRRKQAAATSPHLLIRFADGDLPAAPEN